MSVSGGHIVIVAIGTHGDVAPFTGLGTRLAEAGYKVSIATQRPFADLVTGCGLDYREIPGDPQAIMRSPEGRRMQGNGPRAHARTLHMIKEGVRELDQPFWAHRLAEAGVSSATILLRRLSAERLAAAIQAAVADPSYRSRAQELAQRVTAENGAAQVLAALDRLCAENGASVRRRSEWR